MLVDWTIGAQGPITNYDVAAHNTKIVANQLANFIISSNLNASNVYCIGHSLGAHVIYLNLAFLVSLIIIDT